VGQPLTDLRADAREVVDARAGARLDVLDHRAAPVLVDGHHEGMPAMGHALDPMDGHDEDGRAPHRVGQSLLEPLACDPGGRAWHVRSI
jgi:hypothetical protein